MELFGITGKTSGIGCYMYGSPGNYKRRATNIWSAGLYQEAEQRLDAPEIVTVEVHSDADPALVADELTNGSYDFGPGQAAKFMWVYI